MDAVKGCPENFIAIIATANDQEEIHLPRVHHLGGESNLSASKGAIATNLRLNIRKGDLSELDLHDTEIDRGKCQSLLKASSSAP